MVIHRNWRQPEHLKCTNCGATYSAVGLRREQYELPKPCSLCGFDVYPVWGDRDRDAVRESHTGWNQPRAWVCDNCGATYSAVGRCSDDIFNCSLCYALVYPRH